MLQLTRVLGACILASALVSTVLADAATYYVAATGSNSNPGTSLQPWRTVAHAVNTMRAGDTTYVRGGLYQETFIRFRRTGTQASPIKLLNYPGETPIIHCVSNLTADGQMMLIQHNSGSVNTSLSFTSKYKASLACLGW